MKVNQPRSLIYSLIAAGLIAFILLSNNDKSRAYRSIESQCPIQLNNNN